MMMTSRFWEIIVMELVFINDFKSSALLYVDITLKCKGLDWLVRSHRRVSVGASRNPVLVVTNLVSKH